MNLDLNFSLHVDDAIQLRVLKEEDAAALFQLVDSNRSYLRRFLGWVDGARSEEDSRAFILHKRQQLERKESLTLEIWYENILVGLVGFEEIDCLNHSAGIGYWLDESHQGKGIIIRSVKSLVEYGFNSLGLHRIEIICAVENIKSQAIPIALRFEKEATLKEYIWHYSNYFNAHLYSLISSITPD